MLDNTHVCVSVPLLICCRGYNIGIRLVDEYLAKTKQGRCNSFREAAETVARQALPMFLNITANVTNWNAEGNECSLVGVCVCVCVEGGWWVRGQASTLAVASVGALCLHTQPPGGVALSPLCQR